jgi:hypothetical protein
VTSPVNGSVPPGWYPDPGGERQWRVWTGRGWSAVTRPYGDPVSPAPLAETLGLVTAVQYLIRYGVVATFAGLGLVVSIVAHWPGTAHPIDATLAATLLSSALALLAIGSACYSFAGRELVGRWVPAVLVPGVNVVVVSSMVSRQLGESGPLRRVAVDAALVTLYVLQSRHYPYLAVVPALVSLDLTTALTRLSRQLVGSTPSLNGAS